MCSITPADGGEDLFVHQTSIHAEGFRSLGDNEQVEFDIDTSENGGAKAINVTGPGGSVVQVRRLACWVAPPP
eukprot:10744572-Ditylum_brightwellii.AAC.1